MEGRVIADILHNYGDEAKQGDRLLAVALLTSASMIASAIGDIAKAIREGRTDSSGDPRA